MADVQTVQGSIEAHAMARHVRMSPQKARLVIDLIRGQKAQDALQSLRYTAKRAAKHIEKASASITSPPPNVWLPTSPKRKPKRAFVVPRGAFAKL